MKQKLKQGCAVCNVRFHKVIEHKEIHKDKTGATYNVVDWVAKVQQRTGIARKKQNRNDFNCKGLEYVVLKGT